jgi:uncharacterized protein (DUF58 family)
MRTTFTRVMARWAARSVVTSTGWSVLLASIAALIVGRAADWAEAALAGTAGLTVLALCGLFTIGRTNVRVDIRIDRRRLHAGEATHAHVRLTNLARRPLLPLALRIPVGSTSQLFAVPMLTGGGERTRTFEVAAARRGVIPIGPITTVRADPFGLLARTVTWTTVEEVFVHPEILDIPPIGAGLRHDLEGRTGTQLSSSDLAFHTLRDYVPGDDRRFIHWRSSAKVASSAVGGRLLVRQFLETRRTHVLVIIDGDPAAYPRPEDFEVAISAGASLAIQAVRDRLEATVLASGHVTANGTRQHILDACARAVPSTTPLATLVARAVQVAPHATAAFIVTGAKVTFPEVRRAAGRVPAVIETTILQVDRDRPPGARTGGSLGVATIRELRDLRSVLGTGSIA